MDEWTLAAAKCFDVDNFISRLIVADRKHASTYSPVAFRSVHTGIEPPFLLKIYCAITACMTQGFTSRRYRLKEKW